MAKKGFLTSLALTALLVVAAFAAVITVNPTANTTPDPGQGGSAVTGAINTGHGSTNSAASQAGAVGSQSQDKTCLWSSFSNISGPKARVTLKFSWSINATCDANSSNLDSGASSGYQLSIDYSTNNGGSWTGAVGFVGAALVVAGPNSSSDSDITSGSFSVDLPSPGGVDISQIRVRDKISATAANTGGTNASASSSITVTVTSIRLEVLTADGSFVVMM